MDCNQTLIDALNALANQYLAFDPTIFTELVGGSLVAFATGIGVGAVVKLMSRT